MVSFTCSAFPEGNSIQYLNYIFCYLLGCLALKTVRSVLLNGWWLDLLPMHVPPHN